MTDREKAIVMAYTGICMLTGDKLSVFYEYVESIMGRPVYTHEMGTKVVDNLIKEKARPDFIALCADESSSENPNKWISADVIERIKSEIIENSIEDYIYHGCGSDELIIDTNDVLKIIDKYKASLTGAEGGEE